MHAVPHTFPKSSLVIFPTNGNGSIVSENVSGAQWDKREEPGRRAKSLAAKTGAASRAAAALRPALSPITINALAVNFLITHIHS